MLGTNALQVKAHMPVCCGQDCLVPAKTHSKPSLALEVLAENLEALRIAARDLNTQPKIAKKAGFDQKTAWRIFNKVNEPTLEQLSKFAKAFGLQPWQLLVPGLDPINPPALALPAAGTQTLYADLRRTKKSIDGLLRAAPTGEYGAPLEPRAALQISGQAIAGKPARSRRKNTS